MHKLDPIYRSYHIKNSSGVIWGHRGQKVIFTKKASNPTERVALTRGLCICISLTPSTKVMGLENYLGSFGVTMVKISFSLKCFNLSMLHSMIIRHIHMHQCEILCLCYGVKCQTGVIRGHRGQKDIFTKNVLNRPY